MTSKARLQAADRRPATKKPKPYVWRGLPEEDWEKYEQANRLARDTYHEEKGTITWRYDPRGPMCSAP